MATWREAFLRQARSDFAVFEKLKHERCHRLHYLQMSSEKLAKGLAAGSANEPPLPSHVAIVRMLQLIKGRPDVREALKIVDPKLFTAYVNSLLPVASQIQSLAPSVAKMSQPNPEYPWDDKKSQTVIAPCEFEFSEFNPMNPQLNKFVSLIRRLLSLY